MQQRRLYAVTAAGFVIAVGTGVLLARSEMSSSAPSAPPPSTALGFACAFTSDEPDGQERCRRTAEDRSRRTRLTDAQTAQGKDVEQRLDLSGSTCHPRIPCPYQGLSREDAVRRHLTGAGFRAQVRIAREPDPAPAGAVLYAVEVGDFGCVLGWDHGQGSIVGRLPNGKCLND